MNYFLSIFLVLLTTPMIANTVVEFGLLPKQVNQIPDNYPGNPICSDRELDILDSQSQTLAEISPGACEIKYYASSNFISKIETKSIYGGQNDYDVGFEIPKGTKSIGVKDCPKKFWLMVCNNSRCGFSEPNGHFNNLDNAGLSNANTITICSSQNSCAKKVGAEQFLNPDLVNKAVAPCHKNLVNYKKDELEKTLVAILKWINEYAVLYYDQQKKMNDDIIEYWAAIQKRKVINNVLTKIPDSNSIISEENEKKQDVLDYKLYLESFKNELNNIVTSAKEIRKNVIDERNQHLSYITNIPLELKDDTSPPAKLFEKIYDIKSTLARKSLDHKSKIIAYLEQLGLEIRNLELLQNMLDSLNNGFPDSPRFSEKTLKFTDRINEIGDLLTKLRTSIAKIIENHDQEVEISQKKIDVLLQNVKEQVASDGVAQSLKRAREIKASADFLAEVNKWFKDLNRTFPSNSMGMPFLSERYEHIQDLLSYGKICEGNLQPWMKSGCITMTGVYIPSLERQVTTVKANLETSLNWLSMFNIEPDEVNQLSNSKESRLREVLARYDAILQRYDEGTK